MSQDKISDDELREMMATAFSAGNVPAPWFWDVATELLASRASETGVSDWHPLDGLGDELLDCVKKLDAGGDADYVSATIYRVGKYLNTLALSPAAQGKAEPVGDWQRTVKYLLARCEDYDGTQMSDGAEPMGVTCATLRGAAKAIEGLAATVSHQHEVVVLEREARIKAEAALPHPSIPTSISAGRDEGLEAAAQIAEADNGKPECPYTCDKPGDPTWEHSDEDICPACKFTGRESGSHCFGSASNRIAHAIRSAKGHEND